MIAFFINKFCLTGSPALYQPFFGLSSSSWLKALQYVLKIGHIIRRTVIKLTGSKMTFRCGVFFDFAGK